MLALFVDLPTIRLAGAHYVFFFAFLAHLFEPLPPPSPPRPRPRPPLPHQSKVQKLGAWFTTCYRVSGYCYGAFTMYNNPWFVRAVAMGLWSALRLLMGWGC